MDLSPKHMRELAALCAGAALLLLVAVSLDAKGGGVFSLVSSRYLTASYCLLQFGGCGTGPAVASFTADANPVTYGNSTALRWTSNGADGCWLTGGKYGSPGTYEPGSSNVDGTGVLYQQTVFHLTCVKGGYGGYTSDLTVNVTGAPSGGSGVVAPTISVSPNPVSYRGGPATVSWSSSGMSNGCWIFNTNHDLVWTGQNGSGATSIGYDQQFYITCIDGSNNYYYNQTTAQIPWIAYFYASPASVNYGDHSFMYWSSVGMQQCYVDNNAGQLAWTGTGPVAADTGPISYTQNFSISCVDAGVGIVGDTNYTYTTNKNGVSNDGGVFKNPSTIASVVPTPSLHLYGTYGGSASEGSMNVPYDSSVPITWTSSNVKAGTCSITNNRNSTAWNLDNSSGGPFTSPAQLTQSPTTYTMNCQKVDGSAATPVALTVNVNAAPSCSLSPSSQTINSGSAATINYSTTGSPASLTFSDGSVINNPPASGSYTPSPSGNTLYTATVAPGGMACTSPGSAEVIVTPDICTDIGGFQSAPPTGCQTPVPNPGLCIPPGYTYAGGQCVIANPFVNNFSATPSRVRKGTDTGLSWTGSNLPASCTLSSVPAISGLPTNPSSSATGGNLSNVGPLTAPTKFTLTCGSASATATVLLVPTFQEI